MKKHVFLMFLISSLAWSQSLRPSPRHPEIAGKRADVLKVVPHLSASGDWKSQIILRNDQDFAIDVYMDFYAADGLPVNVRFYDADNHMYEADFHELVLAPFEMQTVEFDAILEANLPNLQAFIFTDELDAGYSIEYGFSNFRSPTNKVATVSSGYQEPGDNFFMNIDQRIDPYTSNRKLRGLAITNTELGDCGCDIVLWDDFGNQVAQADLTLAPLAKYVGTVASLFGNISLTGLYLLDVDCNRNIGVTGLAFENNTPIVGSVPVDYYVFNNKRKVRR